MGDEFSHFFYSTLYSLNGDMKRLNNINKYELVRGKVNRLFDKNIWSVGNKKILIATRDLDNNYVFVRLYRKGEVYISKKSYFYTWGNFSDYGYEFFYSRYSVISMELTWRELPFLYRYFKENIKPISIKRYGILNDITLNIDLYINHKYMIEGLDSSYSINRHVLNISDADIHKIFNYLDSQNPLKP
jgi:hypothetical protein